MEREKTDLLVSVDIHNPNSYPVPAPRFEGKLTANHVDIVDLDTENAEVVISPSNRTIAPGETENVVYRIELDNRKIGGMVQEPYQEK